MMRYFCFKRFDSRRHASQRGVAALEFALVFPIFLAVMCGTFVFSLAYIARQMLGNMASDTARICALRGSDGPLAVQNCVPSVGAALAAQQAGVCGPNNPVTFAVQTPQLPQASGLGPSNNYRARGYLVVVTASCNFTFKAGVSSLTAGGAPLATPGSLQAKAAMPFVVSGGL